MSWGDWVPGMGSRKTREQVDKVFSRDVLGAVFVSSAAGKIVETLIALFFVTNLSKLFGWFVTFILAIYLFAYWDEVVDTGKEKGGKAKERVKEKAEQAKEAAESE